MEPFNGKLCISLTLDGLTVTREETIDVSTEDLLELNGLRTTLATYRVGKAWSQEDRAKYVKLMNARADFAKEIADEVASAIIAAFECTDHQRVQTTALEHEDGNE